jgi:LysM repeat protein
MPILHARAQSRVWRLIGAAVLAAVFSVGSAVAEDMADRPRQSAVVGQHVVRSGETLYCLGRAYGVLPSAIAGANNLAPFSLLSPGQVLSIPAVQWVNIPSGPICATQFVSPFPGLPLSTTPLAGLPPSTPPAGGGSLGQHMVQTGETLYCIGRAYWVRPSAIGRANGLVFPFHLTPGQVLTIPAVRWGFIPPGPVCEAQFPSPYLGGPTIAGTATGTAVPPGVGPTPTPTRGGPTKTPIPTRDPATKTPAP